MRIFCKVLHKRYTSSENDFIPQLGSEAKRNEVGFSTLFP